LKQADVQVWLGLRELYDTKGSAKVSEYIDVSQKLVNIYEERLVPNKYLYPISANLWFSDDLDRGQSAINKAVDFARSKGTRDQYKTALKLQLPLPTNSFYNFLEGRLPPPSHTFLRLIEITEEDEKEKINKEIAERRTRIGARKGQVTIQVKREVYDKSDLEQFYQGLIDWTKDDDQRREFEEKMLQRSYDHLLVAESTRKDSLRERVMELAKGMVIIRRPYQLAWNITLEWSDWESFTDGDISELREYPLMFPETGLAKVLNGYFASSLTLIDSNKAVDSTIVDDDDSEPGGVPLMTPEDTLLLMNEGLSEAKESPLAYRIMSEYYLQLEEYESTVDTVRPGLKLCISEGQKCGLKLQKSLDAMNTTLATALIKYQAPKNHPESKSIFENILKRKPNYTPALLGVGLILEEEEDFVAAFEYLSKALLRDPNNIRIGVEAAWCKALVGDITTALTELEGYVERISEDDSNSEMRAQAYYRIGQCQWDLRTSRAERKDRKGPYAKFLTAIKTDINYPPAYTSLGIYYEDYAKDKKRARQCFQKAFDLSPSEIIAAERLAKSFADQGEWDIVEVIAQRVVDSGNARPPPGSHKKGISWPYSALGVVQMNRQDYQKAIVSFLAALRISPDDYHSYVGLGESYHNSGRYNSALRTFNYAENPDDGIKMKKSPEDWFTKYMLANVSRELGSFDDAISSYREVLGFRKREFGVHIALMQTLLEKASRSIETGFYGRAIDCAKDSIDVALEIVKYRSDAFNLWKGVSDACSIFSTVQVNAKEIPIRILCSILEHNVNVNIYDEFADDDEIGQDQLKMLKLPESESSEWNYLSKAIICEILASKRAVECSSSDIHAQAVAWYNLGWAEYKAHTSLEDRANPITDKPGKGKKYLRAAIRCFKRSIELESGNMEFWNSLGVATAKLNAKVAQHAFVRSLHLNERNPKAWTNLGALYLLNNDYELAHTAFSKAQSADPDYSHAWVGEGIVALLFGDEKEALLHFTHAFEISDSSTTIVKKELAKYSFDDIQSSKITKDMQLRAMQPVLALQQLNALNSSDLPFDHLSALFRERMGNHSSAITILIDVCTQLESSYEESESPITLLRFAQAKSDLARNHLASHNYEDSATEAETSLDLTEEEDLSISSEMRHAIRLSARLTLGLARYYLKDTDSSLAAFRSALEETKASPDVVCSLAEVLWAKGGVDERVVAKEQLFESIGQGTGHVGPIALLGVMAVLEGDLDTAEAVREELEACRTRDDIEPSDLDRVELVLEALAELGRHEGTSKDEEALYEVQRSVMLSPYLPIGWSRLAATLGHAGSADMALLMAERNIPPRGTISPEELSDAFTKTGRIGDSQRAIMVAPYKMNSWDGLVKAISGN
jgi:superkiller protein 3